MSFFTFATFLGQAAGGAVFGWVVQELGFQWVYGVRPGLPTPGLELTTRFKASWLAWLAS